jgi:hypothetical protein
MVSLKINTESAVLRGPAQRSLATRVAGAVRHTYLCRLRRVRTSQVNTPEKSKRSKN